MDTMGERKKTMICLSMHEKYQILQELKNGESRDAILNKYKICDRSLRRIIQQADKLNSISKDFEFRTKKKMRCAAQAAVEVALFKWFLQKRDFNQPIFGTMMQEKARIFNKMLKGPASFKASHGWFTRFKNRHGLRKFPIKGKSLSNDVIDSTKEFSEAFIEKIKRENLSLENIYNADESGIYWKNLLHCILELTENNSVEELKDSKDRFTALFCANASGSHRMPLLIIGKSAKPRDLKNFISGEAELHDINYLPKLEVSYSAQENGRMNCEIFKKWYTYEFIPRVLEHRKKTGTSGKVLLLLDNTLSHPSKEELNTIDENFEVMFLPANVDLVQPMYYSPISSTKKLYKIYLIRKLIQKDYEKIVNFLRELNLYDCLEILSKGWYSMTQSNLKNAWKVLLLENNKIQKEETNTPAEKSNPIYEFSEHLVNCLSKEDEEDEEMSEKVKLKIEEWFNADEGDSGCEIMSDEQIVQSVLDRQNNLQDLESSSIVLEQTIDIHEEKISIATLKREIDEDEQIVQSNSEFSFVDLGSSVKLEVDEDEIIAANEALESFLKFKNWMTTRVQCSESQIYHLNECEEILRSATDNFQNI